MEGLLAPTLSSELQAEPQTLSLGLFSNRHADASQRWRALARWKCKLSQHGLHVGGTERLTNIRYADDIVLYAKSLEELVFMMESLVHELAQVGLQLSSSKTKIFTTQALTKPLLVEVCGEMVEALTGDQTHKHLGRRLLRFIGSETRG